jgi:two-component system, OmpR family, sensor kinase
MPQSFWLRLRERRRLRRAIFAWFWIVLGLTAGAAYLGLRCFPNVLNWKWALGFSLLLLWIGSGAIARRLARPFDALAHAANALGKGKLSTRVPLRDVPHGEARVLGQTLNEMAARIEKQVGDQKALLAMVSHELRTPLSRMRLLAESARAQDQDQRDRAIAGLEQEITEVDELVGHLLASTRLDFGGLSKTSLDPKEVAIRAVEAARVDPSVLDVEEPLARFQGDATLVMRALVNLLENAKKHGGGVTRIHVVARAGSIVFVVEDEGPGIAKADRARIFEAFAHGEERPHSLGLGLSLVRRIAEAHGGEVQVESDAGKRGSRFFLTLPQTV